MTTNSRTHRQPAEPHQASEWSHWLDDNEAWETPSEDLHDGGLHLLDVVAAVDYLTRGRRSGLTVWDVLEEALRWWTTEHALHHHGAPDPDREEGDPSRDDPLKDTLQGFVAALDEPGAPVATDALQQALRRWTTAMAERHNASYHWPHPTTRRSFPPPLQAVGTALT